MTAALLVRTAVFLAVALPSSITDIRRFRIPLPLVLSGIAALAFLSAFDVFSARLLPTGALLNAALAVLSSLFVYGAARVLSAGGLGKGDIVFGVFSALYGGFYENLVAAAFAALLGIVFFLALKVVENRLPQKNVHRPIFAIPFVPFISAGALLAKFLFRL